MKASKWIGGVVLLVLVVAGTFALVTISKGEAKLAVVFPMDYDDVMIPSDSASVEMGRYLAESHGCQGCHSPDYSGSIMADEAPFRFVPSNLTRGAGGVGSSFSDADWLRAIRHGVGQDGRGLVVMPSEAYYFMSDQEVGALIAYLKQVPPVDNELPKTEFRALGKFIMGVSDDMKLAPDAMLGGKRLEMPEKGPTAEWGEYRASVLCQVCHGQGLTGAQPPDPASPPAPDLRIVKSWGVDGFISTIRNGVNPSGKSIDAKFMPWEKVRHLDDTELQALYAYISTL
jgi:mono/diheme cytochrome c family protein